MTGTIFGCFGYAGSPKVWTVQVAATQRGVTKQSVTLHAIVVYDNGPGSGSHDVGNVYQLVLPVGQYDLTAEGTSLGGPGRHVFKHVHVSAGQTSTANWVWSCS